MQSVLPCCEFFSRHPSIKRAPMVFLVIVSLDMCIFLLPAGHALHALLSFANGL